MKHRIWADIKIVRKLFCIEILCEDSKVIWEIVSTTRIVKMQENSKEENRKQRFRVIINAT